MYHILYVYIVESKGNQSVEERQTKDTSISYKYITQSNTIHIEKPYFIHHGANFIVISVKFDMESTF